MSGVAISFVKVAVAAHMYLATPGTFAAEHLNEQEVLCLAKNIYYEARGETTTGKSLVAAVTKNRVNDRRYPNTFCKVVYEPHQFSWTVDRKTLRITEMKQWQKSVEVAVWTIVGFLEFDDVTATHYFNPSKARPRWRHAFDYDGTYGGHAFYTNKTAMR